MSQNLFAREQNTYPVFCYTAANQWNSSAGYNIVCFREFLQEEPRMYVLFLQPLIVCMRVVLLFFFISFFRAHFFLRCRDYTLAARTRTAAAVPCRVQNNYKAPRQQPLLKHARKEIPPPRRRRCDLQNNRCPLQKLYKYLRRSQKFEQSLVQSTLSWALIFTSVSLDSKELDLIPARAEGRWPSKHIYRD